MIKNSSSRYGLISITLHWLSAVAIYGLFGLGLYMTELTYYDPWYNKAPDLHRSIGILLFIAMLARWFWQTSYQQPTPEPHMKPWQIQAANWTHRTLYLLTILIAISGYLISTAKGDGVAMFNWFEIPALLGKVDGMEDLAGTIHFYLAWTLVILSGMHALAAFKHHLIDRDNTLTRILGIKARRTP